MNGHHVKTVKAQHSTREGRQVLRFDFSGRPVPPAERRPVAEERSTIKEAIIRWLNEQV